MTEEDRYEKNRKSVHKICGIIGYRLIGFDPNWSLAPVEERLPKSVRINVKSNTWSVRYNTRRVHGKNCSI